MGEKIPREQVELWIKRGSIVRAISEAAEHLSTEDFMNTILDQDLSVEGIVRAAVVNILHAAAEHGCNMDRLIRSIALGYAMQSDDKTKLKKVIDFGMDRDGDRQ